MPEKHNVLDGNKVYTSGKEGIFSAGMPIGEAVIADGQIEVVLFSDLNQITFVNIKLGDCNIINYFMAFLFKRVKLKFLEIIPLLLLLYFSLNGISVVDFKLFSINLHYILIYYWVLRQPEALGYGFIFISGIITDVVIGLPLGISGLSLLKVAAVAAYVRVVTVRI